jgi:thiamine kinase-like enzyme
MEIIERLAKQLGRLERPPIPLDGGITNRNFRVSFAGRDSVVRLPGKDTSLLGIDREAERIASETAARIGIAPALVLAEPDCLVTEYVPGDPLAPADVQSRADELAGSLKAFHDAGAELPVSFWVPDLLDSYAELVVQHGHVLPGSYAPARELVAQIADALPLDHPVACHNDLLHANLLAVSGGSVLVVDWEYAGMGHRLFDLGNLAVNNDFGEAAERQLVRAYFGSAESPKHLAGLRLMRLMSDAREAMWGVVQSAISELDFDFSGYAAKHFERLLGAADDPRIEDWLRATSS